MAGLEVLYTSVAGAIASPQDAVVCCVHWEIIKSGCRCIGSGDESRSTDRRSELLPTDWNSSNELYTLRYETPGTNRQPLLLKAVLVDSSLFFNLMNRTTQQLSDMTVNINDHINADQLQSYDSAYKDAESLSELVRTQLLPPQDKLSGQRSNTKRSVEDDEVRSQREEDSNPLRNPNRNPGHGSQSHWRDPLPNPFAVGGEDLNPFGSRGQGGMILDPLRSGFPRSGIDPSSGIPDILPPGAVPPGARFDPFGPIGRRRPGPDPDHMPPPGYDDMFM